MLSIHSKLPNTGTTIFTTMSNLANEYNALNLSQGFPSFNCDEELQKLVNENIKNGNNQYAPMPGVFALREAISKKYIDSFGIEYNANTEITITTGATEALYCAFTAFIQAGDEVILIEPCYDSYAASITLQGGKPVFYTLAPANNYKIDWPELGKLISNKTCAIVVNTPQNPKGTIFDQNDLNQLANLLKNTNILVISDEVYEHIIFDEAEHFSVMRHPELQKRSIICGSFGKTFHTTGWKIGFCLAPEYLSAEFRKIHQWVTFSVNTPIQFALAEYLKNPINYQNLPCFYQKKKETFLKSINKSRFKVLPSSGSFFQSLEYSAITNENDFDFAVRLTKEIGVASIPLSVFYNLKHDHKILRFCFAKSDEILEEAGMRLSKL